MNKEARFCNGAVFRLYVFVGEESNGVHFLSILSCNQEKDQDDKGPRVRKQWWMWDSDMLKEADAHRPEEGFTISLCLTWERLCHFLMGLRLWRH